MRNQARRRILQKYAILYPCTIGECIIHSKRGEHPSPDGVIVEFLGVGDIVFVGLLLTFDDDAHHVENGFLVAIERIIPEIPTCFTNFYIQKLGQWDLGHGTLSPDFGRKKE